MAYTNFFDKFDPFANDPFDDTNPFASLQDYGGEMNTIGQESSGTSIEEYEDQDVCLAQPGTSSPLVWDQRPDVDVHRAQPGTSSQAVVHHGPDKDVHMAQPGTSSQSVFNHRPAKDVHMAQPETSSQSVSEDSQHDKGFQAVSEPVLGSKDRSTGDFKFCILAPKNVAECKAYIKLEGHGAQDAQQAVCLQQMNLENFDFVLNFWVFLGPVQIQEGQKALIIYHLTIDDHSSSPLAFALSRTWTEPKRISTNSNVRKGRMVQFDAVDNQGALLMQNCLSVVQWQAMLTQMILLADRLNLVDCFKEYSNHKPRFAERRFAFNPVSHLEGVVKWASKLTDELDVAMNYSIGAKMCLLSVALFELLKSLEMLEDCRGERLNQVYLVILSALHKYMVAVIGGFVLPVWVEKVLREGISNLVRCTSPFSYDWLSRLQVLGRFDPTYAFLEKVAVIGYDLSDVSPREQAYGKAITHLTEAPDENLGKKLRRLIYRQALLAAPTLPVLLVASYKLNTWLQQATDWDRREDVEEETRFELQEAVKTWFGKIIDQNKAFGRKGPSVLQPHLELIVAHVNYSAAVQHNVAVVPDSLANTYRQCVVEMLLEIMSTVPGWELNGRDSKTRQYYRNPDAVFSVDTASRVILDCPYTLKIPLLPDEIRLLLKLASAENDEVHNLGKLAIVKMARMFADGDIDPKDVDYLTKSFLRPWLLASVKHGKQAQNLSPLTIFVYVQGLLDKGVHPSSGMAECLISAAVASSQQDCRGWTLFLADAERMSQLHECLQDHYKSASIVMIHRQLGRADTLPELDRISEQALRALCSQTSQRALIAKEKMQVELCIALLDAMAQKAFFVESLKERAIETISASTFASSLVQLQDCPRIIQEHRIYQEVREACMSFGTSLVKGEVILGRIDAVVHNGQWNAIFHSLGPKSAAVALEDAIKEVALYKKRLQACDILVALCRYLTERGFPIQELQSWCNELMERKETWRSSILKHISKSHWPEEVHPSIYDNLESLLLLNESEIFRRILSDSCQGHFEELRASGILLPPLDIEGSSSTATPDATFKMVARYLVPQSVRTYRIELERYFGNKYLERMNMESLYSLWVSVDAHNIEKEFDLARRELKVEHSRNSLLTLFLGKGVDMVELIQAWKAIKAKGELVEALPIVADMFNFDAACGGYVNKMEMLRSLCDESCTVKKFSGLHRLEGKALLAKISAEEEFAFIQLSKADLLVQFLRDKLNEDFRNLIDAVEEQSDNDFVQESILSDLIDLHRMFRPVLKAQHPTFEQLRTSMSPELRTSTAGASLLGAKLFTCNENLAQICQFLSSVANRGLKMKDHMKRILRGGRYHFTVSETGCHLKLTCGDTGIRSVPTIFDSEVTVREEIGVYLLGELQDIRSRALLVLSTHKAQAKRFEKFQSDTPDAETEESTRLFIEQVDIVEQLVSSISELCTSGHFRFAKFDQTLSGLEELKDLSRKVQKELRDWYAAVKEARSNHSCLNYFRSMELRLFLEVLSSSSNLGPKEDMCKDLLQWAGIRDAQGALQEAKRNAQRMALPREDEEAYLSASLNAIARSIASLFLKPCASSSTPGLSPNSSPSFRGGRKVGKHSGALVLALVEDPEREHDAVVSLFHKRGLSLRDIPRNVLLCSSTTAWEEIHLLLLRWFRDESEQRGGFFCIAYIENLSFDCQAQFLAALHEMAQDWEETRSQQPQRTSQDGEDCEQLALVCCSKSQALLGVSRHLNVRVCHMGALDSSEVLNLLPGCQDMWVITSEIPGLGKTRRIRTVAPGLVQPFCISGSTSRNSLIVQLKELQLQPQSILHLEISTVVNPETFNVLLFELLVLGCLKSDVAGVFHLNTSNIYIELANTLGNELAHSLPVCEWLKREHLTWNLASLEVSDDPDTNIQVVCIYLQAMELQRLDTNNLIFNKDCRNVQALPVEQCQALLKRHFVDHVKEGNSMSFSILEMFVKFFSCQLRNLTESIYFTVENLNFMGAMPNIRMYLVTSLLEVARDLSLRSVKPWLHEQQQHKERVTDLTMAARFEGMLRWCDSNHVMIFFQKDGAISFLYRDANLLPPSIVQLFHSQRLRTEAKNMPDYSTMSSTELLANLWPILQRSAPAHQPEYVLTADNFLKMALIALRVEARVPVIIMGETGCGKTSLLKILARYCGVVFLSITLHAGTTEEDIRSFVKKSNDAAALGPKKVWAFLDEINACDHLGFLNGLICHQSLDGKSLNQDLVVLAACNPYRLHDMENARTGFSARELMNPGDTQQFNLAYRVHPLPEAMLDYVWDFGLLSRSDEQAYIEAMVHELKDRVPGPAFIDLLVQSQAFIRQYHGEASVSLRDVSRCISLYEWFLQDLPKRPLKNSQSRIPFRATLLAFSHCYHSRLANEQERERYREMFAGVIKAREPLNYRNFDGVVYAGMLKDEQMDLLNRMDVDPGIAKNKALLENVFVSLVCMLNHIPVFVVGKPGSGKTLALQLIYGNLRGSESRDTYFKQLPQMYKFSYQGSESSTSQGILKVFEKAYRCKKDNEGRNVLVVVVLDEVGLAEVSSHNPLKVLHALLEPEEPQQVAVVGISNWSLDAAKMNRAIHLAQPDPSETDLLDTSLAILESYGSSANGLHPTLRTDLSKLSRAYFNYHSCQSQPNFHGLRDFYSLIKSLKVIQSTVSWQLHGLVMAVWRNFGGSPQDVEIFSQILKENLGQEGLLQQPPPVMDLVRKNLQDKDARHLMLITTGDSAIGILEKFQENVVIIHGSKFADDCSDDYSYLLLSIVILHMEAGRCILLRGVERLWSSLYDMLNQHYTVVGGRRNCRIAIGAYSNPMCYVHDDFRCIVVVDFSQTPRLDPPFLNRFEKQVLTYDNILSEHQRNGVEILKTWCEQMAGVTANSEHPNDGFKISDLFAGFHEDALPSLVLHHMSDSSQEINPDSSLFRELLDRCKEDLLRTAYVDGMVRASLSKRCLESVADLESWTKFFFGEWQDQRGLQEFLATAMREESARGNARGFRVVITTRTIIHMPIKNLLGTADAQIEKLGDFSSERQLQMQIQNFFVGGSDLLVLQADAVMDKEHIPHAKFLVEKNLAEFQAQVHGAGQVKKNIVLIVHTHREVESISGSTFLSGWRQVTLDQLHREETDLKVFLDHSIADLVRSEKVPIKDIMTKVLTWSFLCIKYPKGLSSAPYCQQMVNKICKDKELWGCFKRRALMWLSENADPLWQTSVASNRGLLSLSSSLQDAFLHYIEDRLREPIAMLVYVLEKNSALGSYFALDVAERKIWRATVLKPKVVSLDGISAPRHPEGYQVKGPLNLSLPFATIYSQQVENEFRDLYLTQFSKNLRNREEASPSATGSDSGSTSTPTTGNYKVELLEDAFDFVKGIFDTTEKKGKGVVEPSNVSTSGSLDKKIGHDITAAMRTQLPDLAACIDSNSELYVRDFTKIHAAYKSDDRNEVDAQAFEWVVRENLGAGITNPLDLHILLWEQGEKIRAQAMLAASCLTESSIADQLAQLKHKKSASTDFDEILVGQCCRAIFIHGQTMNQNLHGTREVCAWIGNLELLIKLATPLVALGGSTYWATIVSLEVLRDLAMLVLPPVSWEIQKVEGLARWFTEKSTNFSTGELLEAVLSLLPELDTLTDVPRDRWNRFLEKLFTKVLSGNTTMADVKTISRFVFQLKICAMKGVVLRLLDISLSHTLAYFVDVRCPKYMQFLLNVENNGGFEIGDIPLDSEDHLHFVLLSDVIYENISPSVNPALLRGEDQGTGWDHKAFLRCLNTALELETNGLLTLQVAAAMAFLRITLDAVAADLMAIHGDTTHALQRSSASPVVAILARELIKASANHRLEALRLYLLKVLHMKLGLSLLEISHLATKCDGISNLKAYTVVVEWKSMHEVTNPLGFDPFWSSSTDFENAAETIFNFSSGQESRSKEAINRANPDAQRDLTGAVASRIYLTSAGRALNSGERATSQWLLDKENLQRWDAKWRQVVQCFAESNAISTTGGIGLTPNMSAPELRLRSVAAHILYVVTALPRTSPLQGYMSLDENHLERAFVLAAPNSSLAAFRTIVENGNNLGEYKCPCGYEYFVGECKRPMQSATCPGCGNPIGGTGHVPAKGNVLLNPTQVQLGYIVDNVARSDTFYSVRSLEHKCYRAMRLILHFCLLNGVYLGHRTEPLLRSLGLSPQSPQLLEELQGIIEEDFAKLDVLLACKREITVKYVHCVVSFLSRMQSTVVLASQEARNLWEAEFARIFGHESFDAGTHKAVADYLERQNGNDRYAELVEERGTRIFASGLEALLRITVPPSPSNYKAIYIQDPARVAASPLIRVFFDHEKELEDMNHVMPLVNFCNAVHKKFSFKISRPKAASKYIRDVLKEHRELEVLFKRFEDSWNAVREKVKGYECKQFDIPIMDRNAPLAMCLVEPRDQGIYIVALFEQLRNVQNAFLEEATAVVGANSQTQAQESPPPPPSVRIQNCKTDEVVHYDQQWLESEVKKASMADPRPGYGQQLLYDDVDIEQQISHDLVLGKARLDGDWIEFSYEHEAFNQYAAILADVAAAIPQEALRPETLQSIQREIEIEGVGAGQFLAMLNLCLGFLRRTGGPQLRPLANYCMLWLGEDSGNMITKNTVFDKIFLKHIVSLYEGLEDCASSCIGNLVSQCYRAPLTSSLADELSKAVKMDNRVDTEEKIPASTFQNVLRIFMFRYLIVDRFRPDDTLKLYLIDLGLMTWPADAVEEVVNNCFPPNLLLGHSYATYMLLAQMYKGGDWKRAGLVNGWLAGN